MQNTTRFFCPPFRMPLAVFAFLPPVLKGKRPTTLIDVSGAHSGAEARVPHCRRQAGVGVGDECAASPIP